jgi:hypothetical protein
MNRKISIDNRVVGNVSATTGKYVLSRRLLAFSVLTALASFCAPASATNVVANGDFSANAAMFTNSPGYVGGSNPASITAWTFTGGGRGINGELIANDFGPKIKTAAKYYAFMQSGSAQLSQTIQLKPQSEYFIGFLAASRETDPTATGRVVVADSVATFYDSGAIHWSTNNFQLVAASFTTSNSISGPVTIKLMNVSAGSESVCFSDVSIDPVLFSDDFNLAESASLFDPKYRSDGSIRSAIRYAWTSTTDVEVNGTLNWDKDGIHTNNNQQISDATFQNMRITNNLAPYVAGKVWEVEFDQRVAWNHVLTFGLSDTPTNGNWDAWDNAAYDFAAGNIGNALRYDTDNDNGSNAFNVASVFPVPVTNTFHHFRIQFNEPSSNVTIWVNDVQRGKLNTLDFENTGRYLSWSEPLLYAGALDNIKISLYLPPYVPPAGTLIIIQ